MKKILFIAGISHSGTSLLDKLLDLHYNKKILY